MKNLVLIYLVLMLAVLTVGCAPSNKEASSSGASCKGIYYTRDSSGTLKKYNEFLNNAGTVCLTDPMELSQWEKTSEAVDKNKTKCVPQPSFASRTVIAANNYYAYRDDKSLIDFDSTTGIYRRLTLGEGKDGSQTFTRVQGCFYQRTGIGVDAIHGTQLMLDTDIYKTKTSESFDPVEIFKYTETATSLEMTRFDSSSDWDYKFCPEYSTPWGYCDLLRNGNIMYYPTLSLTEADALKNEALLIRKQYNFVTTTKAAFDAAWNSAISSRKEIGRNNWKYAVNILVDTPRYIDQAWREYMLGSRPYMPDVNSSQMPLFCYTGKKKVTLGDGSTAYINGEICYINGVYNFTQN